MLHYPFRGHIGFLCDCTGEGKKEKILWKETIKDQLKWEKKKIHLTALESTEQIQAISALDLFAPQTQIQQ